MIPACALSLAWFAWTPPPGDAYRLPPLPYLTSGRLFNQRYADHLRDRLYWETWHSRELQTMLCETKALWRLYDAAEGAHPDWRCSPESKAEYLWTLRVMLGREAYLDGAIPPCVPLHRFNRLR